MNEMELLKCPFCGGVARIQEKLVQFEDVVALEYGFRCWKCGCMKTGYPTRERAIEAWNTRKPVQDVLERLEALTEKYMNNSEKAAELGKDYERHMILNGAKGMAFEEAIEILKEGLK